jgi:hypothetical protein
MLFRKRKNLQVGEGTEEDCDRWFNTKDDVFQLRNKEQ